MDENMNVAVGTDTVTTENTNSNTDSKAAEPMTMTQEEFNKAIQSAEDKLRTKYSKEIKSLQDKVKELSPIQKSEGELELEKRLAELEGKQREIDERESVLKFQAALQKANLDVGMADYIKSDADIEKFATAINALVDGRVKSAGYQPSGHANNQGMTKEKWSKLTYSEKALSIKGAVLDNMATQIAEVMTEKVEKDLVTEMDTNAVYKSPVAAADKITSDEIQKGMKLFKDKRDSSSFTGILIHSRLVPSFMSMPEFVDTNKTYQQNGNGVVEDGVLGFYYQIPVIVTDVNTYDDTAKECKTYIVKKNALGKIVKRDINVEEQRQILAKKTDIAADTLYAVKLIDSKGVVICRKTVL